MNSVRGAYLISIIRCLVAASTCLSLTCCGDARISETKQTSQISHTDKTERLSKIEPHSSSSLTSGLKADSNSGKIVSGGSGPERVTLDDVAAIAKKVDLGFEDGWIAGREARVFKSPYRTLSAHDKAEFALAYHDFLEPFHQDLGNNLATYVPYKTRVAFARKYWLASSSGDTFKKAQEKYQVAWIHESLLDGSELWWRAAEVRFGNKIDSVLALVHDTEQNMVAKYMEDEKTEGTFSWQMTDKSIKTKSVN